MAVLLRRLQTMPVAALTERSAIWARSDAVSALWAARQATRRAVAGLAGAGLYTDALAVAGDLAEDTAALTAAVAELVDAVGVEACDPGTDLARRSWARARTTAMIALVAGAVGRACWAWGYGQRRLSPRPKFN